MTLRRERNIYHLDNSALATFIYTGQVILFGLQLKQGFVVLVGTVFGNVITFTNAGGFFFFGLGHLAAHGVELSLGLLEAWRRFSKVAA